MNNWLIFSGTFILKGRFNMEITLLQSICLTKPKLGVELEQVPLFLYEVLEKTLFASGVFCKNWNRTGLTYGVSWLSGLAYRTQVLVLAADVGSNPAVTLVSFSKTLNHNCFSPPRG